MIPEVGHFALIVALVVALLAQCLLPLVGSFRGHAGWVALARPAAGVQFALLVLAYACLTTAFVDNDFSVLLAAQHSNSALPTHYRVAAVWGNHEGSILLWALILGAWTVAVALFSRQLPDVMVARVIGVGSGTSSWCGLWSFDVIATSSSIHPAESAHMGNRKAYLSPGMDRISVRPRVRVGLETRPRCGGPACVPRASC